MELNGGFPPIKKEKGVIVKKIKSTAKKEKISKKTRFSTTNISNVKIQDILAFVKVKKNEDKIINEDNIDTIDSL